MIGELYVHATTRNGKTFLKNSFHTHPFKLADITEDKNDHWLRLMVMCSSPGILDNDHYKLKIQLEEGSSVEMVTQSYQRLFQMKTGARQDMEVRMGRASSFIFLPQPCVPHESSIFASKSTFHLSQDCVLIWGEVLTCGRKLNGEVFQFSKYHSITEIYLSGRLMIKENLLVAPALIDVKLIGQLEGYTHQGSLTCVGNLVPVNTIVAYIDELGLPEREICVGVSTLPVTGFIVRLLGNKAEQLYNVLKMIADSVLVSENAKEIPRTIEHQSK